MSAAEDLQDHPVPQARSTHPPDALANTLPPLMCVDPPPRGACRAPAVPTARGPNHEGVSCIEGVAQPPVAANEPPSAPLPPQCPSVEATDPDGRVYEGNLLFDVLVYRSLRARQMGGFALNSRDEATLSTLEKSLRPTEEQLAKSGRRNFLRFDTSDIDGIGLSRPGQPVVEAGGTVDLGGGGICIRTGLSMEAGDPVSVHVSGHGEDEHRTVVLSARVAWSREGKIGLMFAGGPSWS